MVRRSGHSSRLPNLCALLLPADILVMVLRASDLSQRAVVSFGGRRSHGRACLPGCYIMYQEDCFLATLAGLCGILYKMPQSILVFRYFSGNAHMPEQHADASSCFKDVSLCASASRLTFHCTGTCNYFFTSDGIVLAVPCRWPSPRNSSSVRISHSGGRTAFTMSLAR